MKILTVKEMASRGGKARAKKLSKKRRKEIALKAGMANKARIEALNNNKSNVTGSRNRIREKVRMRDNYTCQKCGKKWIEGDRRFDVHHLEENMLGLTRAKGVQDYDRNNMQKLVTVCHKCHFQWHKEAGHTKQWKNID